METNRKKLKEAITLLGKYANKDLIQALEAIQAELEDIKQAAGD